MMQRTGREEKSSLRRERSQRAVREAVVAPMEWPAIIIDLLCRASCNICRNVRQDKKNQPYQLPLILTSAYSSQIFIIQLRS